MAKTTNRETCECPSCGDVHTTSERIVSLFGDMVVALILVTDFCERNGRDRFTRAEVKGLYANENITANFAYWTRFGDIIGREADGQYRINIENARLFLRGELVIPTSIAVDKNGAARPLTMGTVRDVRSVSDFLDNNRQWVVRYGIPHED